MSEAQRSIEFDRLKIDAIFEDYNQCHLPGVAVGIALKDTSVYRRGFGLANMELPVMLSPTTRMRVGSSTKQFVAFAYLLLCEEGRAALDDPIGKFLPELHPVTHGVTMRQLMGNTSGLRDAIQISWEFSGTGRRVTADEMLSLYRSIDDVNAKPGTAWLYINGGWLILSAVIERITGQSLEEVLRERVFMPIGMYDSLLRRWDTDFVHNSAALHMSSPDGGYEKSYLGTALTGEGGIVSTVDDLLRWLTHMDRPFVGTLQTWQTMKKPLTLPNGTATGYSMGLMIGQYRGVNVIYHGGSVMGGMTQLLKVPSVGLNVAVITNRWDANPVALAHRVIEACLPGLESPKAAKVRPLLDGVFRSRKTGRIVEFMRGHRASYLTREGTQAMSIDGLELPVELDAEGVFWPSGGLEWMKIGVTLIGDPDEPHSIELSDFGNRDRLDHVKLSDGLPSTSLVGRYRSATTDTDALVIPTEGGLRLTMVGRFGSADYTMRCLTPGIWRAKGKLDFPPGFLLSFDDDGKAFNLWSYRTWALSFRRMT